MWPYPWTHVGTPSHLGHMHRVAATMPSQAHAGAAQEAPNIGQWEGQDVPLVRPSSCTVKGGIPSSRRYLPTYLPPRAPPGFPFPPLPVRDPHPQSPSPPLPLPRAPPSAPPPPHVHHCLPPSPVPILHPQPPPPPIPLPQAQPRPPPPHVHLLLPPLQGLELGFLPAPGPRTPRLVVCPRFAGAPPLGEVGRGSGKARWVAHGAYLRGGPHPHPRRPQRARPGGNHAAGGMGDPPPGRGPGPPPPLHPPSPPPLAPGHPPPGLIYRRPHPTSPPPHRDGKGHRQGEGKGLRGTLRQGGTEAPKVTGRR